MQITYSSTIFSRNRRPLSRAQTYFRKAWRDKKRGIASGPRSPAERGRISEGKATAPRTRSAPSRKWNEISLDTTAIDHTPVDPASGEDPRRFGEQLGPHRAAYAMAIIHIAMFDAENAITKKFVSYSGIPAVTGNVSLDRAIAQVAHDTLVALYPFQKGRLDAGPALGKRAAAAILALRQNDGSAMPEPRWFKATPPGDYFPIGFPNVQPGIWQIDPISNLGVALGGNWPKVKPFVLTSADQFRAPPPPSLTNQAYKQAFDRVRAMGGDPAHGTNSNRTEAQTFSSRFWAYDGTPGLCAPPRLY